MRSRIASRSTWPGDSPSSNRRSHRTPPHGPHKAVPDPSPAPLGRLTSAASLHTRATRRVPRFSVMSRLSFCWRRGSSLRSEACPCGPLEPAKRQIHHVDMYAFAAVSIGFSAMLIDALISAEADRDCPKLDSKSSGPPSARPLRDDPAVVQLARKAVATRSRTSQSHHRQWIPGMCSQARELQLNEPLVKSRTRPHREDFT
jgi:hypothetical protein